MEHRSLNTLLVDRIARHGKATAYARRVAGRWEEVTWEGLGAQVRNVALHLLDLGLRRDDRVAILSETRAEWDVADRATQLLGAVTVGIYPTLPPGQVEYVLRHCGATVAFVENAQQLAKVQSLDCPELERVVILDEPPSHIDHVLSFAALSASDEQLESRFGERLDAAAEQVDRDHWATIIYTSGTTGPPKGAILTHGNLLAEAAALAAAFRVTADDVVLTWLPMAHIFQRAASAAALYAGVRTYYASGLDSLLDDLRDVRPTLFYAVPRIYEKVYAGILARAEESGVARRSLFHWAMKVGRAVSLRRQERRSLPAYLHARFALARRLVFDRIHDVFGGRVRFIFSSGAPIAREVLEFFHAADILTLEGYGATETTAAITTNTVDHLRFGTVGRPVGGIEVQIANDGEILVRGPMVFRGYFQDDALTREVLSSDGWYATGDVGEMDEDGFLRITDRKKDIIVTAGGKNVAPQNIENALKRSAFVSQAMVHGDCRRYLTALITLDRDTVLPWAEKRGLDPRAWAAVCAAPATVALVQSVVDTVNSDLARFEQIKYFRIIPEDFTVADGSLTPTLKLKRSVITERYGAVLDSMY